MSDEDYFLAVLAVTESRNDWRAWGDDGLACGRYQAHPSFYASWSPRPVDFGGVERSWDWCFEWAARRFFRACRFDKPAASLGQIAMAYHLHGQVIWIGFDARYDEEWRAAETILGVENRGV